jgi:hypothetical protein
MVAMDHERFAEFDPLSVVNDGIEKNLGGLAGITSVKPSFRLGQLKGDNGVKLFSRPHYPRDNLLYPGIAGHYDQHLRLQGGKYIYAVQQADLTLLPQLLPDPRRQHFPQFFIHALCTVRVEVNVNQPWLGILSI